MHMDVAGRIKDLLHRAEHDLGSAFHFELPWVMYQSWEHVLFLHWPFPPDALQPHLPAGMELDCFEGQAWVSILPLHMNHLHLRDLPPVPGTSHFPELNFRTYVRVNDQPGVYFFSIDAASWLGAWVAREAFHIPYVDAEMKFDKTGSRFVLTSDRPKSRVMPAARFSVEYQPKGPLAEPSPSSLEHFLVERYALFTVGHDGRMCIGKIKHAPWQVQDVEITLRENTVGNALGIDLPAGTPRARYSPGTDSLLWPVVPMQD